MIITQSTGIGQTVAAGTGATSAGTSARSTGPTGQPPASGAVSAPPLLDVPRLAPLTLAGLTALGGPGNAEAEASGRERFMEAAKLYFAQSLGLSRQEVDKLQINDEAMRYLIRNTIFGALATPGMRKELGLDFSSRFVAAKDRYGEGLARIELTLANGLGSARTATKLTIAFDPEMMEGVARLSRRGKDVDGDRLFTPLDLLPGASKLGPGKYPPGDTGNRFKAVADQFPTGGRAVLADAGQRTFFFLGTDAQSDNLNIQAAGLAFGLLQFARTWAD